MVTLLFSLGAELKAGARRWTPVHDAAAFGHVPVLRVLLEEHGADVAATTATQRTPLHLACYFGHDEAAVFLIDHGAEKDHVMDRQAMAVFSPRGFDYFIIIIFFGFDGIV